MDEMNNGIGIIPGERFSYVDHLVPICQLLDIPLLCTDQTVADSIEFFYPKMNLLIHDPQDFCLNDILAPFDTFFYVDLFRNGNGSFQFFEYLYEGNKRSVCGLHGNSDKKRNLFWAERYADEDVILLYGPHMVDFLKEKGIWERFSTCILTGNYRYQYYIKHQPFFDALAERFFGPKGNKKTILYAPTWSSLNRKSEWRVDHSSFFNVYPAVFDQLPADFELIVKIHPYMKLLFPNEIDEIKEQYAGKENIVFLGDFPLIYPLLSRVDCYLGDYSSIGYDFLTFNRPLFFLNEQRRDPTTDLGVQLFGCGQVILPEAYSRLYHTIDKGDTPFFAEKRSALYNYAFGTAKPLETLKQEFIEALL